MDKIKSPKNLNFNKNKKLFKMINKISSIFLFFVIIAGIFLITQSNVSDSTLNTSGTILGSVYWLKLSGIKQQSNLTIYMGFASNNSNLFNGINVGEAPQLSPIYGQYDDGSNIFLYYSNFTNISDWKINNATVSYGKGLNISFNNFGYVATSQKFGPGTAFMSYITDIGDLDDVGYFDTNISLNGGTTWAGAYIRLACGNTYPDQWNSSGEANCCGNPYGYFTNTEGVKGIYYVEILNTTSSKQFLNGIESKIIDVNYPNYPASVGFIGRAILNAQWAAVLEIPPNGVMPSVSFGTVHNSSLASGITVPQGIEYYLPIKIYNNQSVSTQSPYQQMIVVNSSLYSRYEASNLQNIEFFYPNGTIIPSWLEMGNSNTAGLQSNLIIKVNPAKNTSIIFNGQLFYPNETGTLVLSNLTPGKYNIFVQNPYYAWFFNTYNISAGTKVINITLNESQKYIGEGAQYPWVQIGPAYVPNPFDNQGTVYFNASGHIGLIKINPKNPNIIYIASGFSENGITGPIAAGGVYVTYNDGKTWLPRDFGLPYGPISALYLDPYNTSILLVAVSNHGIYRSTDGGLWWYQVSNITQVNNFQQSNGTIFAGSNYGIIESKDYGQTWKIIYHSNYFVGPISVSKSTIYAMVWGPGAPGMGVSYIYLLRSTDMGSNWTLLHTFIGNYPMFISASPFNPLEFYFKYAYPGNTSIMYSNDGGLTYITLNLSAKNIIFDPNNSSIIFGYGPFIYSFDGGKSFKVGTPAIDQMGLDVYTGNGIVLVLGSDQGLYQSNDLGITWKPISGDLSDMLTYSVSVGGNGSKIAVGMQDYSAFISLNGGKTWIGGNTQPIPIGGESTDITINPGNSSWIYAFSWSAGLSVSNDSGITFKNVVQGSPIYLLSPNDLYVDPYNNSRIYFAYTDGIYNGTYYGKQWQLWYNSPHNATTIVMPNTNSFLVGTTDGVYYSINGSWIKSNGIYGYVTSIAVDPINSSILLAATGMFSQGSLYISYNGGKTFNLLNQSLGSCQEGLFGIPLMIYWLNTTNYPIIATTVNNGILISLDQGKNWVPINYNLRSGEITSLSYDKKNLYISTYGEGILEWDNFSVSEIPGTINGYVGIVNATVYINGTQIPVFSGHWQAFLKPGTYDVRIVALNLNKTYIIKLSPMQTVNLTLNQTIQKLFNVNFTESGLPSGTIWYVNLSNGQSFSGKGTTITFSEPNGTYSYTIATVNKSYVPNSSSSTFTINGANVNIAVTFTLKTYTVTFTESGLPSGTIWYVNLSNSQSYSSSSDRITFNEPNGTYSYIISSSNKKFAPIQYSGSFIVNGANMLESITFSLVTYKITFTESGLSSGTTWYVTFNNITKSSSNNTIIFNEPNGSYSYIIQGISGYKASNYSGSLIVNGNSINENIVWSIILYSITITENGIPNGTEWSATLTGTTFNGEYVNITLSSTSNKITFNEPNGTYTYIIHLPSGYQSISTKGSISVSGNSALASFTAQQATNYLLIGIIAVIVLIAIVAGVIFIRKGKSKKPPKE